MYLLEQILNGVCQGMIYALMAIGYSTIVGVTGQIMLKISQHFIHISAEFIGFPIVTILIIKTFLLPFRILHLIDPGSSVPQRIVNFIGHYLSTANLNGIQIFKRNPPILIIVGHKIDSRIVTVEKIRA